MGINLFNFLNFGQPVLGEIKYYNENSIFNQDLTTCGNKFIYGSSLTLGESIICGDTYLSLNLLEKNPKPPNLFVSGNIFGFKNLTISNISTFNNTVIANRNVIVNGKITLAGCGDVAMRINRADTLPSSDLNLKTNIAPIKNALNKVIKLRGVSFDFKNETDYGYLKKHQIGLIAQEVEKVIPEVVSQKDNGYLGVSYQHLIPLLIEAIKEQQERIDELEHEIRRLEK